MTRSQPEVTVVVPCYNQARFLVACLESIQAQTFTSWEAIVVDDASTDASPRDLAQQFDDRRIRVIRHARNQGQGAARNTGFRAARSQLVVPMDSDDLLRPEFLAETTSVLTTSTGVDCVFTDLQLFGGSTELWKLSDARTMRDMLLRQWVPGAGTVMRREVWERAGGYTEDRRLIGNEDWDFWIAALASGVKPAHLPQPLYLYRRHESSMSSSALPSSDYLQRQIICDRHRALYDRYGLAEEFVATGFVNTARHAWKTGDKRRAASLAARGLGVRRARWSLLRLLAASGVRAARAALRPAS